MADKKTYWIADTDGSRALVEGADERDRWVAVHGWTEASEPDRHDFVWVRNADPALGAARMTFEAAQLDAWSGRGWAPGAPPEPVNAATAHWPAAVPAPEPPKSSPASKSASSGESKEKVNG